MSEESYDERSARLKREAERLTKQQLDPTTKAKRHEAKVMNVHKSASGHGGIGKRGTRPPSLNKLSKIQFRSKHKPIKEQRSALKILADKMLKEEQ